MSRFEGNVRKEITGLTLRSMGRCAIKLRSAPELRR